MPQFETVRSERLQILEQHRHRIQAIFETTPRRGDAFRIVAQEFGVTPDDVKRYYYRHLHHSIKDATSNAQKEEALRSLDQFHALVEERNKALQRVQEIDHQLTHMYDMLARQVATLTEENAVLQQKLSVAQEEILGAEKLMQRIQEAMRHIGST